MRPSTPRPSGRPRRRCCTERRLPEWWISSRVSSGRARQAHVARSSTVPPLPVAGLKNLVKRRTAKAPGRARHRTLQRTSRHRSDAANARCSRRAIASLASTRARAAAKAACTLRLFRPRAAAGILKSAQWRVRSLLYKIQAPSPQGYGRFVRKWCAISTCGTTRQR